MTDQSKKRRAAVSGPTGPDRKKRRRVKFENSDSDEPIALYQIPSHPPSPDLPRTTRSNAPGPVPAPAPAARQPDIPLVSTGSVEAIYTPCLHCVKKWTEDDSTICPRPRDAPIGKCRSCSRAGAECSLLPKHFYDPLAAAQKATGRARRRACASLKSALEAYERKNEETGISPTEKPLRTNPPKENPPKENPPKENAGSGSSAQERPEKGELLKAIRSLDKNVFRLMNTIREVRGLELISDEA
ncbi:hypothetical protein CNMCM5793_000395 [Aspergillus hiratsukae]|uniref:Uncharacterized protein n=1 Tax=Aspergillus hiratsukae TaxID=1194566 RepID=A0A8H6P9H8_9EURO|nr:hypothetical protein CNMCM5793_000395 [Aspergillus hiratsukae]KAF7168095.1 hypothetical protein CNMCM6106_003421 [Aspergillus hiratsukae]